jgi:hypothetical protein
MILARTKRRRGRRRVSPGLIVLVLFGIGLGIYLLLHWNELTSPEPFPRDADLDAPAPATAVDEKVSAPAASAPEETGARVRPPIELPPLQESDPLVRELAGRLSLHPKLAAWLLPEGLIERFVAVVANISGGESPSAHIDFLAPEGAFSVIETEEVLYIDPRSYDRYNLMADAFASLDTQRAVAVYVTLRPLIDEAYRDLGHPDEDFDDALRQALYELLEVPVLREQVAVTPRVLTYKFADRELEALSPAQRHFLRMGPTNIPKIRAKLREIASALGIPRSELPPEAEGGRP